MMKVARPSTMSNRTLNRLILAVVAILIIGGVAVVALYVTDRYRPAAPTIVDQRTTQLEAAVRKTPEDLSLRLQLAGAYSAAQRYDDALSQYNVVLQSKPQFKSALLGRGQVLDLKGDKDGAAKDFQAVVDLAKNGEFAAEDNELAQADYGLGEIRLGQGKAEDAVTLLKAALAITKTDADTLNLLGQAFLQVGDTAHSIEALRGAVLFVPTNWPDPYATLAKAYTAANQPDEAAWATAMVSLANKQTDNAIATLKPLASGPAATDAKVGLGLAMEAKGDLAGAVGWYKQAIVADPQNFSAQAGLARVTSTNNPHPSIAAPSLAPSASPAGQGA